MTETTGAYRYELILGLPHTNHRGLAEHLALAHFGHLYWTSIARAIGRPLSSLRSPVGEEVYATFYFVEETFPESAPIDGFRLDVTVRLRAFKGMAIEGNVTVDHATPPGGRLGEPGARVRFASIFITPSAGNSALRVVAPVGADFSGLPPLPLAENPHHITKAAEESGRLGLLGPEWQPVAGGALDQRREIDPDRDSNGAGLVYFANYLVFMNAAERAVMREAGLTESEILTRAVRARRIAYYGNAGLGGDLVTRVALLRSPHRPGELGFRYAIHRAEDDARICLSEAVKTLAR